MEWLACCAYFPMWQQPPDNAQVEVNLQRIVMMELQRVLGTKDYWVIRTVAINRALGNRE